MQLQWVALEEGRKREKEIPSLVVKETRQEMALPWGGGSFSSLESRRRRRGQPVFWRTRHKSAESLTAITVSRIAPKRK